MSNSVSPFIKLAESVSRWSGAVTPNPAIEPTPNGAAHV
jgi:hypothetical protein